jgi:hypothetical protein
VKSGGVTVGSGHVVRPNQTENVTFPVGVPELPVTLTESWTCVPIGCEAPAETAVPESVSPVWIAVVTVGLTLFTAVKHSFVVTELTLGEYSAFASGVYSARKQ